MRGAGREPRLRGPRAPFRRARLFRLTAALLVSTSSVLACAQHRQPATATVTPAAASAESGRTAILDALFADPALAGALAAVRVESLADGRVLYERNADARVIPASTMKIVTAAVAAERLGWDFRFETRLEMTGTVRDGVLHGDLVVVGGGDPSISAQGMDTAPLFVEWRHALESAGIRRVEGRIVGDDNAFDNRTLGAGWAWDYLSAGYAAPSSALSYNENVAVVRISPGRSIGETARIELAPPGHALDLTNAVTTSAADVPASIVMERLPGSSALLIRGTMPVGAATLIRTTAVDNPTRYFVEALRIALLSRGIVVTGGAWDIDDLSAPPAQSSRRRVIATRLSQPISVLIGYAMKVSQNFYGDMLLKAIGAHGETGMTPDMASSGERATGSAETGRAAVRETLAAWGVPADALAMYDGSGLSRYNYASADLLVDVLAHVWHDERLRGPFAASLPVGGRDGTLENRMRNSVLDRHVQAKTGTIANVRSLAGYIDTPTGEKLVFAMIANHFAVPTAEIDRIMERALEVLIE